MRTDQDWRDMPVPTLAQITAMRENLAHCHDQQSRNEFLRVWIRDWTEQKLSSFICRPIPLSERLPEPGEMDGNLVWAGCRAPGLPYWEWCLDVADLLDNGGYTHWLPANTRFLPARVEG